VFPLNYIHRSLHVMFDSDLKITLGHERLKPLHQILNLKLLASPEGAWASRDLLRRDEHVADDLDHTVLGDAVLDRNATKAIDLDADEATISSNVNAEAAILEHGREVNVEVALRHALLSLAVGAVVRVRVESVVRGQVVLEKSLKVLLTVLAEEESVDPRAELLESKVRGCEESTSLVVGGVDHVEQPCLAEAKLKSRELARKQINDGGDVRWRQDDGVDAVDDTVGTQDVDGDNPRVEVDSQSSKSDVERETLRLRLASEVVPLEERGNSVGGQHAASRIKVLDDMVRQQSLDELLAGLLVVFRDLFESLVGRGEDSLYHDQLVL
jgi:hypothetical protein